MISLSDNFWIGIEWAILYRVMPSRCLCPGKASIWLYLQDQHICIECKSLLQLIFLHRGHNWVSHVKGSKPSVPLLVISIFSPCSLRDPVCQQIEVGAGMGWSTTMVCTKRLLSILGSKFTFVASEEPLILCRIMSDTLLRLVRQCQTEASSSLYSDSTFDDTHSFARTDFVMAVWKKAAPASAVLACLLPSVPQLGLVFPSLRSVACAVHFCWNSQPLIPIQGKAWGCVWSSGWVILCWVMICSWEV